MNMSSFISPSSFYIQKGFKVECDMNTLTLTEIGKKRNGFSMLFFLMTLRISLEDCDCDESQRVTNFSLDTPLDC